MGLVTFNNNVLSALDVETTGITPGCHEIVQIAIVPLDDDLNPMERSPFYMKIKPEHPERAMKEAMVKNRLCLRDLEQCPTQIQVADTLEEWFQDLKLPLFKRLICLTHNGKFDVPFVKAWLGEEGYHRYFCYNGRDTMELALGMNDQAAFKCRPVPFAGVGLRPLCNRLGVLFDNHHDALADSLATAKVYRELLRLEI